MRAMTNTTLRSSRSEGQCGRWADDEELFVSMSTRRLSLSELESDVHTWVAASSTAFICALAALTLLAISTLRSITKPLASQQRKHALVLVSSAGWPRAS